MEIKKKIEIEKILKILNLKKTIKKKFILKIYRI